MTPMVRRWIWIVAAAAVLGAGCGSANGPATASAQPNACAPAGTNLALVTLRGSTQIVIQDITDINHPRTLGTLGTSLASLGARPALEGISGQFISASEVSNTDENNDSYDASQVFRRCISGSASPMVTKTDKRLILFAWSRDGRSLAYLSPTDAGSELHQVRAGEDRTLAVLPLPGLGGGCEVAPCPGPFQNPGDTWHYRLAYSPDGNYISMVQNGITSYLRIFTTDGKQVAATDSAGTTMSVWSGNSLYFRDSVGVEVWRNGAVSTVLRGVSWIRPKASSDGRFIVYEARELGAANVFVLDTATGQVRALGAGSEPAFLTSGYVWFETEPPCVPSGTCQAGFPGIAAGKTYIYDMEAGTKSESVLTSVLDVWPHAA